MHRVYTIVKKNSQAHQQVLASNKIKNDAVVAVGFKHVLIPAIPHLDFGHNVSHAKNRTQRIRRPNLRSMKIALGKISQSIRISAKDMRTYKKLTKSTDQVGK